MKDDRQQTAWKISELAAEFDVSPRTIRYYEKRGLISPQRTRGNYRLFDRSDRVRLKLILRGRRLGFSLEEIREMIGLAQTAMDEASQIEKSLAYGDAKLGEIRRSMEELKLLETDILAVRAKLLRRLEQLKKGEDHRCSIT